LDIILTHIWYLFTTLFFNRGVIEKIITAYLVISASNRYCTMVILVWNNSNILLYADLKLNLFFFLFFFFKSLEPTVRRILKYDKSNKVRESWEIEFGFFYRQPSAACGQLAIISVPTYKTIIQINKPTKRYNDIIAHAPYNRRWIIVRPVTSAVQRNVRDLSYIVYKFYDDGHVRENAWGKKTVAIK